MATYYYTSTRTPAYFAGGRGDDHLISNGTPGLTMVGGDGDDDLNPGIVKAGARTTLYGDGLLGAADGFPENPARLVYDQPGSIAHRAHAGNDVLHIGMNITGKGGAGHDTYVVHGPVTDDYGLYARVWGFDWREDTIVLAHDEGITIDHIKADLVTRYSDGSRLVSVKTFQMHGETDNPAIREQHVEVYARSIHHDADFHDMLVRVDRGETYAHAVTDFIMDHQGTAPSDFWV